MHVSRDGHDILDAVYPLSAELWNLRLFYNVMPLHTLGSAAEISLQLVKRFERTPK